MVCELMVVGGIAAGIFLGRVTKQLGGTTGTGTGTSRSTGRALLKSALTGAYVVGDAVQKAVHGVREELGDVAAEAKSDLRKAQTSAKESKTGELPPSAQVAPET